MATPPSPLYPHHNLQTNQNVLPLPPPRNLTSSSLPTPRATQSTSRSNNGRAVPPGPRPQSVPSSSRAPLPLPNASLVASPPVIHGSQGRGGSAHTSFRKEASAGQKSAQACAAGCASSDHLPPSYRFTPTEEELVTCHLLNHIRDRPTGVQCIHTVSLYDYNPEQLTATYEKSDLGVWYFYTRLNWKYTTGNMVKRTASGGYWRRVGSTQPILQKNKGGLQIGTRRDFDFYIGQSAGRKGIITNWALHEYRMSEFMAQWHLPPRIIGEDKKMGEWVLCTIYERELSDDGRSRQERTRGLEPSPLDLLCNKLRGRKRSSQDPAKGTESLPPANTPILITDSDVDLPSDMELRLDNKKNTDHHQSYGGADINPLPPLNPTVQNDVLFLERTRVHESFQDSINGHLHAGNQTMQYYALVADDNNMLANELACDTQGISPTAAPNNVIDCEMWVDGVGSDSGRSGFGPCSAEPVLLVDMPTDRVPSMNTPSDGYNSIINAVLHDVSAYDPNLQQPAANAMDPFHWEGVVASAATVVPNTADTNLRGSSAAFVDDPIWPLLDNSLVGTNEQTGALGNSLDGLQYFANDQTWAPLEDNLAYATQGSASITTSEIDATLSEMLTRGSSSVNSLSMLTTSPPDQSAAANNFALYSSSLSTI